MDTHSSEKIEALEEEIAQLKTHISSLDEDIKNLKWPQRHRAAHHNAILKNLGSAAVDASIFNEAQFEHPVNIMHQVTVYNDVKIGRWSYVNVGSVVYPNVQIGRFCSIARYCEIGLSSKNMKTLTTHDFIYNKGLFPRHEEYANFPRIQNTEIRHKEVKIGNDVWIGAKAIIMGGITIGNGSVIGAGSVVTKDIPPYSIAAGCPAKVIKKRFTEEQIEALEELQWWELELEHIQQLDFEDIDNTIRILRDIRADEYL